MMGVEGLRLEGCKLGIGGLFNNLPGDGFENGQFDPGRTCQPVISKGL